jgi:DNA-directed RNA polymerase specialized sigma24 family protein
MLRGLPANHREVVRLRLEGLTFKQIADRLQMHERTARKVIQELTPRTEDWDDANEDHSSSR